ncbi:hypothetical protein PanWU01x14_217780 [Parasponia andersonii]|uniref:Uncharacterized protein n=1 Tax=Parasponia andersonii TaxID=3476 RepID=A0A2P5BQZ9_PARAD|nr:hypothetical protein PanWU01x14_217780 [Parasponia andersonii]
MKERLKKTLLLSPVSQVQPTQILISFLSISLCLLFVQPRRHPISFCHRVAKSITVSLLKQWICIKKFLLEIPLHYAGYYGGVKPRAAGMQHYDTALAYLVLSPPPGVMRNQPGIVIAGASLEGFQLLQMSCIYGVKVDVQNIILRLRNIL